ncbi:MAG: Rab family GTPase [Candidatus Hodarchaeota archaeon]
MTRSTQFTWKIVTGGAGGVGKTTFLHKYLTGEFLPDTKLTVGVQFHSQVIERFENRVGLVLWDLGGQERFRFVQGRYIKGAVAALVFFDLSRYATLTQVPNWVEMIRENSSPLIPIILIGNKADLVDDEEIELASENAREIVKKLELTAYLSTSAKSGKNVVETIEYLVDNLLFEKTNGKVGAQLPQAVQ